MIRLNNCLFCCCHFDNRKEIKEKHCFSIRESQAEKYRRDIAYIKKEHKTGRDGSTQYTASLGSAGYTFFDDIERLANFAYNIGEKNFYEEIRRNK